MVEISAQMVKQLREMTGAGMMDCKKALVEVEGDIEAAVEHLRKTGIAKAAQKVDRESKDGRIEAAIMPDNRKAVMIELSSETDFVAKNDEFVSLSKKLAELALQNGVNSVEELTKLKINDKLISDVITELVAKVGENIKLKRVSYFEAPEGGFVLQYIHPGNKVGVMIEMETAPSLASDDRIANLAKEIAMQIAFSKPVAISNDDVPQEVINKEREIYEDQARQQGKPDKAIPKIVEGRLRKFLQESCLLEQEYIRDSELTIRELIEKTACEVGDKIAVKRFVRFEVGTM